MRPTLPLLLVLTLVACGDSSTPDSQTDSDVTGDDASGGSGDGADVAPEPDDGTDTRPDAEAPDTTLDDTADADEGSDVATDTAEDATPSDVADVEDADGSADPGDATDPDAADLSDTADTSDPSDTADPDTASDVSDASDTTIPPDSTPDAPDLGDVFDVVDAVDAALDALADTVTDTADAAADVTADTTPDVAADTAPDVVDDGCPDELFVVSPPDPANSEYPDPELSARCTDTTLIVESNAMIGYEYQAMTPNPLEAQAFVWEIPLTPTALATPEDIPLLGTVGFTRNGIPIYGPNEGPVPDPYGDPIYNAIVDWCLGHTGGDADYHYHAILAECVLQDPPAADGPSPILGFALDGYPIYGPRACVDVACTEIIEVRSGWVATGDPTTYAWDNHSYVGGSDRAILDQCNGRVQPDGSYGYHATETFPYVLGCYHGEANTGGGGTDPGGLTPCTSTPECVGECGTSRCVCAMTLEGMACVPGCTTAADCPTGGPTFTCRAGTCVPSGPPPGP